MSSPPLLLSDVPWWLKLDDAGTIVIGGHAQVVGVAQIDAKLELVVANDLGPVVHELIALLFSVRGQLQRPIPRPSPIPLLPIVLADRLIKDQSWQSARGWVAVFRPGSPKSRGCGDVLRSNLVECGL